MLKKCAMLLGLVVGGSKRKKGNRRALDETEFEKNKGGAGTSMSFNFSSQSKDIFVRIVFAGGREELYRYAVPAVQLMEKYPGMRVAKPEVFKNPHQSLLWPEEKLLPGHKYFIVPSTTVQKLKHKHEGKAKTNANDSAEEKEECSSEIAEIVHPGRELMNFEESIFSAKDFYVPKEKLTKSLHRRGLRKKKPFHPPIPKARPYKGPGWEPSLSSVQELSP
ncbi:hypothetical protein UlMin_040212 [Ulmus minor]